MASLCSPCVLSIFIVKIVSSAGFFKLKLTMKFTKIAAGLLLFSAVVLLAARPARASEGTVELRATTEENYRCFAASLQMQDLFFRVLVSCRDLIYPAGPNIFTYIVWAIPSAGGGQIKLGELGFGKAEFRTNETFSSLFVTTEADRNVRSPTGPVVMQGRMSSILFLDRPTTPTPVPEGETEAQVEIQELSNRERLSLGLRRAGLAALLALLAVIGLVFVLTRGRR